MIDPRLFAAIRDHLELGRVARALELGARVRRMAINLQREHEDVDERLLWLQRREAELRRRLGRAPREAGRP